MGYCMRQEDHLFFINVADLHDLAKACRKACEKVNFRVEFENIYQFFEDLYWELVPDIEGNIHAIFHTGEKMYKEDELFEVIAPYVKSGSFIEMNGEDGYKWRWVFKYNKCNKVEPNIIWPEI